MCPSESSIKTAAQVAQLGNLLCSTIKEKNDWKKRMLATQHGMNFPPDFDNLTEKDRESRLDKAIAVAMDVPPPAPLIKEVDRDELTLILAGEGDWFTAHLLRLICRADSVNRAKLHRAFPEEVNLVHQHLTGKEFKHERNQ